jgi:ribosomal protein S27E
MSYENSFHSPKDDDICEIECPNPHCENIFIVSTSRTHENFKCEVCGSTWSAYRKERKNG